MNKKTLGVLLIAMAASLPVQAQTTFGDYDCGEWFKETKRHAAKAWLLGFLSGMNVAQPDQNDPLGIRESTPKKYPLSKLKSADQAFLWMDNFCKASPLESVSTGAYQLFRELQKRPQ